MEDRSAKKGTYGCYYFLQQLFLGVAFVIKFD